MPKVTITVDQEVLDRAKRDVARGKAPSVSAWFNQAAAAYWDYDSLDELLDEMLEATGGPPTEAELAVAREHLRRSQAYAAGL